MLRRLRSGALGSVQGREALWAEGGGKMFGVLVVADTSGRVGWLQGFSGMWGGTWVVDGCVPPLFEPHTLDAFWQGGQRELAALTAQIDAFDHLPVWVELETQQSEMRARHGAQWAAITEKLSAQKAARAARRAHIRATLPVEVQTAALAELDQESREAKALKKQVKAQLKAAEEAVAEARRQVVEARQQLVEHRERRSQGLQLQIHDAHTVLNARGEEIPLVDLYPGQPPAGSGDCAGPKLLGAAHRLGLTPLAMAEFWWGSPPRGGGRRPEQYAPACAGKCGPLLPFMLEGVSTEVAPLPGEIPPEAPLEIIYEDQWLVVVSKPSGLLSVPGRSPKLLDSVQHRLQQMHPALAVAHRLDLDTSGLLVAAKDLETLRNLQQAFARRRVSKTYCARLAGVVKGERGRIELPLGPDVHDRPRQKVHPQGKVAITEWRVLERGGEETRVEMSPITGRTHQLRVHAAHPRGLDAPIMGDRIYGSAAERLYLHAEQISFEHPREGHILSLVSVAPF